MRSGAKPATSEVRLVGSESEATGLLSFRSGTGGTAAGGAAPGSKAATVGWSNGPGRNGLGPLSGAGWPAGAPSTVTATTTSRS